jgi:aerobic carbon-monoxide dehydrogenase medium subunit
LKPAPFEYLAPATVEEAVSILERYGDEAKVLAGGQSLVPLMVLRLARPTAVVDLERIGELSYLRDGDMTVLGAMVTHREIETNGFLFRRCPMIREAMSVVGHVAIRNRGTVGGSCAHADPAAEWSALALALDAEFDVTGPGGTRTIPAPDLFFSYLTTSLEPEEILTEIRLRIPPAGTGTAFMELSRRHGDFGIVGVAAAVGREDDAIAKAKLALLGVGGVPVRTEEAERVLGGSDAGDDALEAAARAVNDAISPTGDIHGSEDFRSNAAMLMTKRAIRRAYERAGRGADGR